MGSPARLPIKGLVERLKNGETIVVAEGYLFEFERRCYLRAGDYIPEVVLKHPDLVRVMHEEFVHAGSDVVLAFTYYGHREKLREFGMEEKLEQMNRTALRIARQVADETGTLMAGDICNTTAYNPDVPETHEAVSEMFKEQVLWAVEEGADFIVAETFGHVGEALLAQEAINKYGNGLPSVVTMVVYTTDQTFDGVDIVDAMKRLEQAGATVVGLNCGRGPRTIVSTLKRIQQAVNIPVAALPVPYRCDEKTPTLHSLVDPISGDNAFPLDLGPLSCSRSDIRQFAQEMKEMGIQYVGLCCGNCAHYTRTLAETLGHVTPGSIYSPDLSNHFLLGNKAKAHNAKLIQQMFGKITTD